MNEKLHPYVVFLPSEQKSRVLGAIFGSKAAVDILRFSLNQGIAQKIYQQKLMEKLAYSNKTIIETLKSLVKLEVLAENMEKTKRNRRTVWVKAYELSDVGKWFALLLAEERDLSASEKAEILQNLFRTYVKWVKNLSTQLHIDKKLLEKAFKEEME